MISEGTKESVMILGYVLCALRVHDRDASLVRLALK